MFNISVLYDIKSPVNIAESQQLSMSGSFCAQQLTEMIVLTMYVYVLTLQRSMAD